jgi:hypothetical protein
MNPTLTNPSASQTSRYLVTKGILSKCWAGFHAVQCICNPFNKNCIYKVIYIIYPHLIVANFSYVHTGYFEI